MARGLHLHTNEQWQPTELRCRKPKPRRKAGRNPTRTGRILKESCGCCGATRGGGMCCPSGPPHPARAGGAAYSENQGVWPRAWRGVTEHTGRTASVGPGRVLRRRELSARARRGDAVGQTKCGEDTERLVVADGMALTLRVSHASVSPAEVTLVEQSLETVNVPRRRGGAPHRKLKRLIVDNGCDANWLHTLLWSRRMELVFPGHKRLLHQSKFVGKSRLAEVRHSAYFREFRGWCKSLIRARRCRTASRCGATSGNGGSKARSFGWATTGGS